MKEQYNLEKVEVFIIETLLKKGSVVIPDFGFLKTGILENKRTVLFQQDTQSAAYSQIPLTSEGKVQKSVNVLYAVISRPLKEGQVVTLPKAGTFRPTKREDGRIHISFIPSAFLRQRVNSDEKVETKVMEIKKDIRAEEGVAGNQKRVTPSASQERKPYLPTPFRKFKAEEIVVQQDDNNKKINIRYIIGIGLIIVALIVIAVSVYYIMHNKKKKSEERVVLTLPSGSMSLPSLAEQHYGNSAFWIYIYQANSDKLSSPINIPRNVSLVIPDLKTEFNVDVNDSMEIRRAKIRADIVLKEEQNKVNRNNN